MTARLYMFRGSEADNDVCAVPFFEPSLDPEPMTDDMREAREAFREACAIQDAYVAVLMEKWQARFAFMAGVFALLLIGVLAANK